MTATNAELARRVKALEENMQQHRHPLYQYDGSTVTEPMEKKPAETRQAAHDPCPYCQYPRYGPPDESCSNASAHRISKPAPVKETPESLQVGEDGERKAKEIDGPADMRRVASCLTYNGSKAEGSAKHLLLCAAMKIDELRKRLEDAADKAMAQAEKYEFRVNEVIEQRQEIATQRKKIAELEGKIAHRKGIETRHNEILVDGLLERDNTIRELEKKLAVANGIPRPNFKELSEAYGKTWIDSETHEKVKEQLKLAMEFHTCFGPVFGAPSTRVDGYLAGSIACEESVREKWLAAVPT